MAICAKKGYHVVWVPSLVEDSALRGELEQLLTKGNVSALCYAEERHRNDVGRLNREMKVRTVITYRRERLESGKIVLNPINDPQFQPYTELYLLVENLMDADFYKIVLKLFRDENGYAAYECIVYPLMGGGVTTARVMENEVRLRQHYCLAIADSDKLSPQGKKGDTVTELLKAAGLSHFNCGVCWLENVSEIENMIPRRVVRYLYPLPVGGIDIFTRDPSFFDMKCGLELKKLVDDRDCIYWRGLLPEKQADFNYRDTLKTANPVKRNLETALNAANRVILNGFGTNLLKRVMNVDSDAIQTVLQENIQANHLMHQTRMRDLNTFQQREWTKVGKTLFEWACGMKAM